MTKPLRLLPKPMAIYELDKALDLYRFYQLYRAAYRVQLKQVYSEAQILFDIQQLQKVEIYLKWSLGS